MNNPYKKNHEIISTYLNMLTDDLNHGLIVLSKGGLGKTTLILDSMKSKQLIQDIHYIYANSFSTPLAFYKLLDSVNALQSPKILILDDMELLLSDKHILGMLRAALWEAGGKRVVNYHSTTQKKTSTDFTGKIIMLINDLPKDNKVLNALCDRVFFHEIKLSNNEILELIQQNIVQKPYKTLNLRQRVKIAEAIKERTTENTNLSFRTLIKAYQFYIYAPSSWLNMLDASMNITSQKQINTPSGLF